MKKIKYISVFLLISIILSVFASTAFADTPSRYIFDEREATAFIGFIFNINPDNIRATNYDDNSIYKLLTGQYESGSQEESIAKIAFLSVAYENISLNIEQQSNIVNASRAHLLEYLEKHASEDIAGDMANGIIKNILQSVSKCILYEIFGWDMDIVEAFELAYDTIKNLKSLPDKSNAYAEKVQAALAAGIEAAGENKQNMYMFFNEYVNANISMGEYADIYMEGYDLQLTQKLIVYDPILNWHSEGNIETLKRWARYVADIELSLSGSTEVKTDFDAKFSLNYPFAQDIVCYTAQETVNFIQSDGFIPERDGYIFEGWYYDAAGTSEWYGDLEAGQILFAKWQKKPETKFQITFKSNCAETEDFSYVYDTSVGNWTDCEMSRPGYILEGWYWDADCTERASGTDIVVDRSLTFYANWHRQFTYTLKNNNATITGLTAFDVTDGVTVTDIAIPKTIDGYTVVAIGTKAFENSKITGITISDTVTTIGEEAFYGCKYLKNISIPSGITTISSWAFANCSSLCNVYIDSLKAWCEISFADSPANPLSYASSLYLDGVLVTQLSFTEDISFIGNYAFYGFDALTNVIFSAQTTEIGKYAFQYCKNLTDVYLSNSIAVIGEEAFSHCTSLKNVSGCGSLTKIGSKAFEYCSHLTAFTLPDTVTEVGSYLFSACTMLKAVNIADTVKTISDGMFSCCINLENFKIPKCTAYIGGGAFFACEKLANITIPETVTYMGEAFNGCISLTEITIPGSVESISGFSNCTSLRKVTINDGVKHIGNHTFQNCPSLESIEFPGSIESFGINLFAVANHGPYPLRNDEFDGQYNRTLKTVVFYEGIKEIGSQSFMGCLALETVSLPKSLQTIKASAFAGCASLEEINIPDNVSFVGPQAFSYCLSLEKVTIPDKVTAIARHTFMNCSSLKTVTLPEGIAEIGMYAFSGCTSLSEIILPDSISSINEMTFYQCKALIELEIPEAVSHIGKRAFSGSGLEYVYLSANVTDIEERAFYECENLKCISVSSSSSRYFSDNYGVLFDKDKHILIQYPLAHNRESYTIPDSVTEIATGAFADSRYLTDIYISANVKAIGANAFQDCDKLRILNIPDSVEVISEYCFRDCDSLKYIILPESVQTIGEFVFSNCKNLKTAVLNNRITKIPTNAFRSCSNLKTVVIGSGVQNIEDYVFDGCDRLSAIYYMSTQTDWNKISITYNSISSRCNQELSRAVKYYNCSYASDKTRILNNSDNTISVHIEPDEIYLDKTIVCAAYSKNKLLQLSKNEYKDSAVAFTLNGTFDIIKVMVFDNLTGLKPLCTEEVIPGSKWE